MEDKVRGQLARYYDGELKGDEARAVELHLATCAACRDELHTLRALSTALGLAAEEDRAGQGATAAEAAWQRLQPRLGEQPAGPAWRSWLPGLLLLGLQGLMAVLGLALTGGSILFGWTGGAELLAKLGLLVVPLPGAPAPLLPLPGAVLDSLLYTAVFASAGVLYLIWLAVWWSRSHGTTDSVKA